MRRRLTCHCYFNGDCAGWHIIEIEYLGILIGFAIIQRQTSCLVAVNYVITICAVYHYHSSLPHIPFFCSKYTDKGFLKSGDIKMLRWFFLSVAWGVAPKPRYILEETQFVGVIADQQVFGLLIMV